MILVNISLKELFGRWISFSQNGHDHENRFDDTNDDPSQFSVDSFFTFWSIEVEQGFA